MRLSQVRSVLTKAGLPVGLAFAFSFGPLASSLAQTSAPQTATEAPVSILLTAVDKEQKEVELVNPAHKKQGVQIAYPHGYFAGNASNSVKN